MDSTSSKNDIPKMSVFSSATIYTSEGEAVPFSSLFEPSSVLVVSFIRHFNCGSCQGYVEALGMRIPLDKLHRYNARLIVIGHGESKRIDAYNSKLFSILSAESVCANPDAQCLSLTKDLTHCPFEMYCDPKRHLYRKLDLGQTR